MPYRLAECPDSREINFNGRILDGIGLEGSEQTESPFIGRARRTRRMKLAQLGTEQDKLPLG